MNQRSHLRFYKHAETKELRASLPASAIILAQDALTQRIRREAQRATAVCFPDLGWLIDVILAGLLVFTAFRGYSGKK